MTNLKEEDKDSNSIIFACEEREHESVVMKELFYRVEELANIHVETFFELINKSYLINYISVLVKSYKIDKNILTFDIVLETSPLDLDEMAKIYDIFKVCDCSTDDEFIQHSDHDELYSDYDELETEFFVINARFQRQLSEEDLDFLTRE